MIKVLVSQPGRQHTHILLKALYRNNLLSKFYTVFAARKLKFLTQLAPKGIRAQLKKRSFPDIPESKIEHKPTLFIREQLGKVRSEIELLQKIYDPFDSWVAQRLISMSPDILIGYENANFQSFKKAKELGVITVLDLAQIHHNRIKEINEEFQFLDTSYTPEILGIINERKSKALQYTDYIITLSSFAKNSLVSNGIDKNKIFTVNLGLSLKNFYPKVDYAKNEKFQFLFVGTITKRKGLKLLLEAFKSLELMDSELVLIGPMSNAIDLLERYKGFYSYYPFMHHEELGNAYRTADVFVFPSYLDSWAQTVVEAMACGTPAIVSENTGAKDAVVQGGGFVVSTGDVKALKDKMLYLYEHKNEVVALGRRAAKIASNYTLENYHGQIVQVLNTIGNEKF